MKYFKIIIFLLVFFSFQNSSFSKEIYFIDLKKILNESKAGKKAQDFLKKKYESENKKFEKEGTDIRKEETELISKKKINFTWRIQKKS